jgi:hypothetical protein
VQMPSSVSMATIPLNSFAFIVVYLLVNPLL